MTRVFQILLEQKLIDSVELTLLKNYQERWPVSDADAVLDTRVLTEGQFADALAAESGLERLHKVELDSSLHLWSRSIEWEAFLDHRFCPVAFESGVLYLVVSDPGMALSELYPFPTKLFVSERSLILEALARLMQWDQGED